MSGHSKWSKVKHQKAVTDVIKASAFTKAARAIYIAVKDNGRITDPDKNFKLRLAIEKARSVNMPKENIERAISKAGSTSEEGIIEAVYEAIGPGNISILINSATDNSNRTHSLVKNTLERNNGTMVSKGAVSHLFKSTGRLYAKRNQFSFDQIFEKSVELGADDVFEDPEGFEIFLPFDQLQNIRKQFEIIGLVIEESDIIMKPLIEIELKEDDRTKLEDLITKLEDLEDVQKVYTNSSE
jgi:YebC/PmpR family DNA-binding regulatory protein